MRIGSGPIGARPKTSSTYYGAATRTDPRRRHHPRIASEDGSGPGGFSLDRPARGLFIREPGTMNEVNKESWDAVQPGSSTATPPRPLANERTTYCDLCTAL